MKVKYITAVFAMSCVILQCRSVPEQQTVIPPNKKISRTDSINFRFEAADLSINNPDQDKRVFFKIFIDKIEMGRTGTGLESQKKSVDLGISSNSHLLVIEKWILDERASRYVKVNNIDQPKPNFLYFDLPEDKKIIVRYNGIREGKAEYRVEYED